MDTIIERWQEYVSLAIVIITVAVMIRSEVRRRKDKKDCSGCALVEIKSRQQYHLRNQR